MSGRLALANAIDGAGIEQSEGRTEPGRRRMTRSDTLAVGKVKLGDRDRRNRAIVKRLAAGASTRAVGAEFGLTPAQISRIRVQVTGVRQRPTYAPWPTKRIARLRLLWRRGLSAAEIGRLLGMSKSAVVGKIDRLELPPPSAELQARKRRRAGRPPFWVASRIAKLRKLWGTLPNAAIARELGISKAAVFRQAYRLALPPPRSPRPHATRHAGPPAVALPDVCPWALDEFLVEGEGALCWKPT